MAKTKKKRDRGGRPALFENAEEMRTKIEEYVKNCPDTKRVFFKLKDEVVSEDVPCPGMTGLALYLGFNSRSSLYEYEKK